MRSNDKINLDWLETYNYRNISIKIENNGKVVLVEVVVAVVEVVSTRESFYQ